MIKIEHPDLDKIAKAYFVDVKERIKERSEFLLHVLDVLFNGMPFNILENHSLHGGTKKTLINQLLSAAHKLTDQTQYSTVTAANLNPWVVGASVAFRDICNYLNDDIHLEELILCIPDTAIQTENAFKVNIGLPVVLNANVKNFVNNIIDYSIFKTHAYDIAKSLNVNTCPYCNRNYINTVIDKKVEHIIRPTFDHFFPQKLHPFLALSFYNLIPSCYFCNSSLKSSDPISIDTHIHPYKEGFDKDATFQVLISNLKPNKSDPENYSLFFADNMTPLSLNDRYRKIFGGVRGTKTLNEGNVNLFKLDEIYQSHLDIVGELRVKADKLNSWYGKSIVKMFPLLNTNVEEFYQYYFGNYFNEKNFHRRPMAKLSKDVVSQLVPKFAK
jgi:hypothetical protein